MIRLVKHQQLILGVIASVALFLIGAAIMTISLIVANQQAVGIKVIF